MKGIYILTKFYDLAFAQMKDGSIRLTQSNLGVDCTIHAHPEQLAYYARQLCESKSETTQKIADLERRLSVITDKLQDFVCNEPFRNDLIKYCVHGFEYLTRLDALLDLALEFDGGRLMPVNDDDSDNLAATKTKALVAMAAT